MATILVFLFGGASVAFGLYWFLRQKLQPAGQRAAQPPQAPTPPTPTPAPSSTPTATTATAAPKPTPSVPTPSSPTPTNPTPSTTTTAATPSPADPEPTPAPAATDTSVTATTAETPTAVEPEPVSSAGPAEVIAAIAPPTEPSTPAEVTPAEAVVPPTTSETAIASEQTITVATSEVTASLAEIPQCLVAAKSADSCTRATAAALLGAIATTYGKRAELLATLPTLDQLSRDPNTTVRQNAIASLGQIPSEQVIPLLQKALRDTDPDVVKIASGAIARYKTYAVAKPKAKPANAKPKGEG